ncbi:MAG TPA: terminase large subunit [Candidatus Competibacter phosphatis]|nr:terminase large subunit [Candidatus Competibacter phosphatis]
MASEYLYQQYIDDVLSGRQVCCKWVWLAVERHVRDLETGAARGLRFDEGAARHVIDFFGFLRHSKGEWAGRVVELEPWQQFMLGCLFGWQTTEGRRRFRTAYLEISRKNGKSLIASGVGLYLLDADGEGGAEVYSAATKRAQAKITFDEAARMVKASPFLRRRIRSVRDNLHILGTASKFEPLGRDADSMDGLNIHGAIIDELHAHKTRDVWDVLETATGARRQPLMFAITTAGFDRESVCWELHDYAGKVLEGVIEDDSFFGMIFSIDADDDWEDEATWVKANPNLGVSVKPDDLRAKAAKAREMPSALNGFLRLHLNVWTQSETRWMDPEKWNGCAHAINEDGLRGRTCYAGLDLASTTDVAGYALVFPPTTEGDRYQCLWRFFIPAEAMRERERRDRVPYSAWVRGGFIQATPGNIIDYEFILQSLRDDSEKFDIKELAFDRWGSSRIQTQIADEWGEDFLVGFGQGFASMSGPTKELERLILDDKLAHGGNPVMNWMMANAVIRMDPAQNIKIDRARSTEKVDGCIMVVMGLDRALRHQVEAPSVYEERGIREL